MAVHPSVPKKIPLLSLQAWQLKQLAFLIGLGPGANKAETAKLLARNLYEGQSRLSTKKPDAKERHNLQNASPRRTLSIDMGVKNLAFCIIERPHKPKAPFHLMEWQRWDVTKMLPRGSNAATLWTPSTLSRIAYRLVQNFVQKPNLQAILIERQRFRSGGAAAIQEWTVRVNMLEAMLWSSLETLRSYSAEINNSDDGYDDSYDDSRRTKAKLMGIDVPPAYEISPARVGGYWSSKTTQTRMAHGLNSALNVGDLIEEGSSKADWEGGEASASASASESELESESDSSSTPSKTNTKTKTKRGFEKKEKIALVRSWFERGDLTFDPSLTDMVDTFLGSKKKTGVRKTTKSRSTGEASKEDEAANDQASDQDVDQKGEVVVKEDQIFAPDRTNKMDDLADCIVQAVTFSLWQRNRQEILMYDRLTWEEVEGEEGKREIGDE